MKKIIFLTLLGMGSIFTLTAQDTTLIYGKWAFKDATEKEKAKMDSTGLAMLPMFFGDMSIEFKSSGLYDFQFMNKPSKGSWDWDDNNTHIELVSDGGEIVQIEISELNDSSMVMALSKGVFIMNKVWVSEEDVTAPAPVKVENVSATVDQVAKKWFLQSREGGRESKYQQEVDLMLSKNLYMKLHANGKFDAEVLIVEDTAHWHFGVDNKSIIITSESGSRIWYIASITKNEMKLRKGKTSELWTFSSKLKH